MQAQAIFQLEECHLSSRAYLDVHVRLEGDERSLVLKMHAVVHEIDTVWLLFLSDSSGCGHDDARRAQALSCDSALSH